MSEKAFRVCIVVIAAVAALAFAVNGRYKTHGAENGVVYRINTWSGSITVIQHGEYSNARSFTDS